MTCSQYGSKGEDTGYKAIRRYESRAHKNTGGENQVDWEFWRSQVSVCVRWEQRIGKWRRYWEVVAPMGGFPLSLNRAVVIQQRLRRQPTL